MNFSAELLFAFKQFQNNAMLPQFIDCFGDHLGNHIWGKFKNDRILPLTEFDEKAFESLGRYLERNYIKDPSTIKMFSARIEVYDSDDCRIEVLNKKDEREAQDILDSLWESGKMSELAGGYTYKLIAEDQEGKEYLRRELYSKHSNLLQSIRG